MGFEGRWLTSDALMKWNGVVNEDSKSRPSIEGWPSAQYPVSISAIGVPYLLRSLLASHITLPSGRESSVAIRPEYSAQ